LAYRSPDCFPSASCPFFSAEFKLDWPAIILEVDARQAEYDENEYRQAFTRSERHQIAEALKERFPNRQGRRTDLREEEELVAERPQVEPGRKSRDDRARAAGFSSNNEMRRVESVIAHGCPELVQGCVPRYPADASSR
jgi:hypothetical protein